MLRVAYIQEESPRISRARISERDKLHREAVETLAKKRVHNRTKALKSFANELHELEELKLKLNRAHDKFYKRSHGV